MSMQNLQLLEHFILHIVYNMLQYRCGGISYDKLQTAFRYFSEKEYDKI